MIIMNKEVVIRNISSEKRKTTPNDLKIVNINIVTLWNESFIFRLWAYPMMAGYGNDYLPWLYTQPLQNIGWC
jgi:hypothetical protein